MILQLKQLPDNIKGPTGPDYKGQVPKRFRFMEPETADAFNELNADMGGNLACSDVYRDPAGSLAAVKVKRGVQPPGFSPHNFGFAFDVDVDQVLRLMKWSYARMIDAFADHGFYCHRRDMDPSGSESWHFNYLGPNAQQYLQLASSSIHQTWSAPVEKRIQEKYGVDFKLDAKTLQAYLKKINFYGGDVDGAIGTQSRAALGAFQRAWVLYQDDNVAFENWQDARTQRVLAVVAADKNIIALQQPNV